MRNFTTFPFLLLLLFLAGSFANAQTVVFSDNFDSYAAGSHLAASNPAWTTWNSAPGSAEDGVISNVQASSVPNSLFISEGKDQLFVFDSLTEGRYVIKFNMYIPSSGNGAYFNIMHILKQAWALQCHFHNDGTGFVTAAGDKNFNYPVNAWFPVEIDMDLDGDWASLTINNSVVKSWPFHYNCNYMNGVPVLSGVDFFSASAVIIDSSTYESLPGTYYVDDFTVLTDVTGGFNVNPNLLVASLAPNNSETVEFDVVNAGIVSTECKIATVYDIPNPDTTSTGAVNLSYLGNDTLDGSTIMTGTSNGQNIPSEFEFAVCFPSSVLQNEVGKSIKAVSFSAVYGFGTENQTQNAKIKIYDMSNTATSVKGPGELIYEQSVVVGPFGVNNPQGNWTTVYLDTLLIIDGRDLWVSVWNENPNSQYLYLRVASSHTANDYSFWRWRPDRGWYNNKYYRNPIIVIIDGTPITPWLSVSPDSAVIASGGNATVNATFNSEGMEIGESHTARLHCFSNAANNLEQIIPVTLEITGVSVDEHNQILVNVYPNPSTDHLNITSDEIQRVEIHNMMGQRVFDSFYHDTHVVIPTRDMAPGTYMVTVTSTQGVTTKKVILR